VGSQGIRRRKPEHHLPKVHNGLSADEEARAFGQFRWGQFTPAGALERSGFLIRQAVRRSEHPGWQKYNRVTVTIGWSLIALLYGTVALFVILALLHAAVGLP
jgi:hypothetical protein